MAGQTVVISVLADTKKFASDFKDAGDRAGALTSAFRTAGAVIGVAALAVGGFVAASVKAAADSEKVAAQTAAVVKSTGGAAERSAEQIGQLATKLSRLSGIDDEVVQSGENILATFTQIKGVTFDKATKSALDMSVAMGTDLNAAALQVGKALNDPIAGVAKLTKVGVTFTQQQKDQIANFVKMGDVASAQGVILAELDKEFGGSAEAFGNTFEGTIGKVRTSLGNIQEQIGSAFLPAFTKAGQGVADILDRLGDSPKFTAFLDGLAGRLTNGLKPINDLLAKTAGSDTPLKTFTDGLAGLSPVFAILQSAFTAIAPVMPIIQKAFADIGTAIGSGLQQYLPDIATAFGQITTALIPLIPQILALIPAILPIIPPLLQLAGQVIPPLVSLLGQVLPPAIQATTAVLGFLGPILGGLVDFANGAAKAVGVLVDFFSGNLGADNAVAQISSITGPFQGFAQVALGVGNAVGTYLRQTIANFQAFGSTVSGVVTSVVGFFAGLPGAIGGALAGVGTFLVTAGQNLIGGFIKGITGAFKTVESTLRNLFGGAVNLVKGLLGIRSPSRVFAQIGAFTVAGLEQGLSGPNRIRSIMDDLSGQVTGGFNASLDLGATSSNGTEPLVVNVNGGLSTAPEIGRAIVAAIDQYKRTGGVVAL